jgi:hypothetical protein
VVCGGKASNKMKQKRMQNSALRCGNICKNCVPP